MRRQLLGELGTGSTTQGWHQDSASWRDIFPMDLVSAWTAIENAMQSRAC